MRRSPRTAAVLLAGALLAGALGGCRREQQASQAPEAPSPGPLAASPPPTAAQQALLDQLPPAFRHADLQNGALHFNLCRQCHSVAQGGPTIVGPPLYGVFGRKVASVPGYAYSAALSAKTWTWDADRLDPWLKSPRSYVPGTKMSFYGIPDEQDRRDLIAYLKVASSGGGS